MTPEKAPSSPTSVPESVPGTSGHPDPVAKAGVASFVFVAVLGLSLLGVSVWALVALVSWAMSK